MLSYENPTLFISGGNKKIGMGVYSFSTLPGNEKHMINFHGEPIKVVGTCSGLCSHCFKNCYARRFHRFESVIQHSIDNTLLLRKDPLKLFNDINTYINEEIEKIELFRWNVSGEIESYKELIYMNEIAKKHPNILFGIYTKNFVELEKFFNEVGDTNENFCINISQWHHCADRIIEKYKGKINVFEYDDSNKKHNDLLEEDIKRLFKLEHCEAVDIKGKSTGKQCKACKNCYTKSGKTTAVYSH